MFPRESAAMLTRRRDWDAAVYHRVSAPQFEWGQRVLERLELQGDERVLDAGCGTGRLTALLHARLPRGEVVAMDRSRDMTARASEHLPHEVEVVQADLLALPFAELFDVVFSTATFHWVLDPAALYRSVFQVLVPGGRLHAQCGGLGNLAQLNARVHALMLDPRCAARFTDWREPWLFLGAEPAAALLRAAGFSSVQTRLRAAPARFESRESYREFVQVVVLADYLARIEGVQERDAFVDTLVDAAGRDDPPFVLDYVRLELEAVRPEKGMHG